MTAMRWVAVAAVCVLGLGLGSAEAESTQYFTDAGGPLAWDEGTTTNWGGSSGGPYDQTWGTWNYAIFEGLGGAVNLSGTVHANGLTFNAEDYVLQGGGTLQTGSPVGGPFFTVNAATATVNAAISYTGGGMTKSGAGTLILGNVGNQYFTSATIAGGVLELNVPADLDSGAGTTFYGTGTLRKTGGGNLLWGSAITTFALGSGSKIEVMAGSLTGGSYGNEIWTNNLSDLHVAGGASFNGVEASVRVNRITGSGTITSGYNGAGYQNFTIGVDNGSSTFDGVLADGNARFQLVKTGSGAITLTGASTYSGQTIISGGTLVASNSAALGAGGHVGETMTFIQDGATLALQGGVSLNEHFHVWGAGAGGAGAIRNLGGDNALTDSYALRSQVTVGVDAGSLAVTNFYEDGGIYGITKVGTGTLNVGSFSSSGSVSVDGGTVQMTGGHNNYWSVGGTTLNAGGKLSGNTHSHIKGLTFAGGELASTGTDGTWGGWMLDQDVTVTADSGTSTLSASQVAIANAGAVSRTFDVGSGATLNVTGNFIDGYSTVNNGLTKSGNGTMILTALNSFTGGTTVNGGLLDLAGGSSGNGLIRGAVTVNAGAELRVSGGDGTGFGYNDQGLHAFNVNGGLVQSTVNGGCHIWNATVNLSGGELRVNGGVSSPTGSYFEWGNVALNSLSSTAASVISGRIRLRDQFNSGVHTFNVENGSAVTDLLVSAAVTDASGNNRLTKTGGGTMALTGNNSYTGGTTVNGGALAAKRSTLGTGAVVVNADGTLNANDQWVFAGNNYFAEMGWVNERNVASVTVEAGGTLHLDETQGYANGVTDLRLNGGSVTGGANSAQYGDLFLYNGSESITAGGATTSTIGVRLAVVGNNNTITVNDNSTLNITGVVAGNDWGNGGFVKAGNGTLALTASNAYTGATTVNAGTLRLGGAGVLGNGAYAGAVTNNGALVFDSSAAQTLSGAISGSGTLTASGSGRLTLAAANTYAGATTVSAGTLALSGSGSIASSPTLTIESGATVDVTAVTGGSYTLGAGQTLRGNGTVVGGLILGSGSVLAPGNSTGTNYFDGALTLDGVTNVFELVNAGDYDQAVVAGSLTLKNKPILQLDLTNFDVPFEDGSEVYTIFELQSGDAPLLTDTFWLANGTQLTNGTTFASGDYDFQINYDRGVGNNDITLTVVPEPGTVGLIGMIGFAGYLRRRLRG